MSLGDSSTELKKVRGLGSAKEGGEHWIGERVSSVALLLLGTWLIASLLMLPALDHATVSEWLRTPLGAVPMNTLLLFLAVGGAALALFALGKIAFGGGA